MSDAQGMIATLTTAAPRPVSVPAGGRAPGALDGHRSAYLLGIGGVGMSAGAELLATRGLLVQGSDAASSPRVARLRALGVSVHASDDPGLLPADLDLVVASAAIPAAHPQLAEARRRGIEVWKYADLLGALMADRFAVCVAGTHGKTTTTALVATALLHARRDPTFVVGGDVCGLSTGARCGAGEHFVAESCEYDRSFHRHRPRVALVTNVDADHLDYYRDLAEIEESFRVFAALVPSHGCVVAHESCAPLFRGDPRVRASLETYGSGPDADWQVGEPVAAGPRRQTAALRWRGRPAGRLEIPLLGRHNALNAAGAVAALVAAGLSLSEALAGIASFQGVGRRLELLADRAGVLVYDDYGHHPAEIAASLEALRSAHPARRVVLVFQPHQASRTRLLLDAFARALAGADEVWLPPIYLARDSEADRRAVASEDLARAVGEAGGRARAFPDLSSVEAHALSALGSGDLLVTMGAGNVDEVAHGLARRLP